MKRAGLFAISKTHGQELWVCHCSDSSQLVWDVLIFQRDQALVFYASDSGVFSTLGPKWKSLYSCKEIVLRRNTAGSLGFSIVGGYEENCGNRPFFIKSIVEGTPAYNDGRIRCGDILLAVNGRNISGMAHASLARMLKELKGKLTLTIVSWPGTFL